MLFRSVAAEPVVGSQTIELDKRTDLLVLSAWRRERAAVWACQTGICRSFRESQSAPRHPSRSARILCSAARSSSNENEPNAPHPRETPATGSKRILLSVTLPNLENSRSSSSCPVQTVSACHAQQTSFDGCKFANCCSKCSKLSHSNCKEASASAIVNQYFHLCE